MVNSESVQGDAIGTLAEWIDGYTQPAEGPQHRVKIIESDDDSLLVSYDEVGVHGPVSNPQFFRIRIEVTEAPEPGSDPDVSLTEAAERYASELRDRHVLDPRPSPMMDLRGRQDWH
jgi:hypothetical protein